MIPEVEYNKYKIKDPLLLHVLTGKAHNNPNIPTLYSSLIYNYDHSYRYYLDLLISKFFRIVRYHHIENRFVHEYPPEDFLNSLSEEHIQTSLREVALIYKHTQKFFKLLPLADAYGYNGKTQTIQLKRRVCGEQAEKMLDMKEKYKNTDKVMFITTDVFTFYSLTGTGFPYEAKAVYEVSIPIKDIWLFAPLFDMPVIKSEMPYSYSSHEFLVVNRDPHGRLWLEFDKITAEPNKSELPIHKKLIQKIISKLLKN